MFKNICYGNCEECRCTQSRLKWVLCSNGQVPDSAVFAGRDKDGEALYVGRATHGAALIPGKVKPSNHGLYLGWTGREHWHGQYEVLVSSDVAWKPCEGRNIPPQALIAGHKSDGENLYVGRAWHDGNVCTPGKVVASEGCLYVSYDYAEFAVEKYEILILCDQVIQ